MLVGPDHNAAAKGLIGPKDTVIAVLGPDSMKAVNVDDEKFSNVAGNYCPKVSPICRSGVHHLCEQSYLWNERERLHR